MADQGSFYDRKRAAAQHFYRYELPKVGPPSKSKHCYPAAENTL
jgi:hypothetical protein